MQEHLLLTIGAAAKKFDVSVDQLRRLEYAEKIEALRTPGGHRRYIAAQLEAYFNDAPKKDAVVLSGLALVQETHEFAKLNAPMATGIDDLDDCLYGGIRLGEIIVITGEVGSGKTRLWTQMLPHLAKRGNVLVSSTCMPTGLITLVALQQYLDVDGKQAQALMANQDNVEALEFQQLLNSVHITTGHSHVEIGLESIGSYCDQIEDETGGPVRVLILDDWDALAAGKWDEYIQALSKFALQRQVTIITTRATHKNLEGKLSVGGGLNSFKHESWIYKVSNLWYVQLVAKDNQTRQLVLSMLKSRHGKASILHYEQDPASTRYKPI